jgi:ATP-dependent exoDNAse (exonuclease V) beta subunit
MNEVPAGIDVAARDRAVDSVGSVLVQAPAGSGKTTLLVQRYLRLLSRVEAPERILALTFTRRAAQEMRERILAALESAARGASAPGLAAKTWQLARSAAAQLQRQKIDLQREPARLRIETIDAFNAWLAAQLPIGAGGAGLPVQPQAKRLYQEAARRALAYEAEDDFGRAVERVLELDDQRWLSLLDLLADMLATRDRWLPLLAGRLRAGEAISHAQLGLLRAHFDEDLALLMSRVLHRASALLGAERLALIADLMRRAARRVGAPSPDLLEWRVAGAGLSLQVEDIGRWRAFAQTVLTRSGAWRKSLDVRAGFPPGAPDKETMQELIGVLKEDLRTSEVLREILDLPPPRYSDSSWERARDVAQLMVLAAAELEGVFREEGMVDFTAISLAALRALQDAVGPSDLALRLDYRLEHVLVDEFQDTSSAQLELLKQLIAGWSQDDGRSVFCVGDPMQSIYGFRQAEVRAFLELADQGIGAVRFEMQRLTSNFRSASGIVEWVNQHFSRIMPSADNRERGAIAFRFSHAARTEPGGVEVRAFASAELEARAIAAAVSFQQAEHPDWRIAVLVRARTHAHPLMGALRSAGVAFRAVDIETLKERAVVRDLLMLLRALSHLGDRIAWLALLRAPWTGLALADLWHVARAPLIFGALGDAAILDALSAAGRPRAARLHEVLTRAFACRSAMPFERWVENTWLALGGAAIAAEEREFAAPFFERLRDLSVRGLPEVSELDAAFDDLYATADGTASVEIMTIHKAKGLEFDMVMVPALAESAPAGRSPLLLAHPFARVARDGMVMAAKPPVGTIEDPLFNFLKRQVQDANALEAERLLYVACTRAKRRLWLSATLEREAKADADAASEIRPPRAGSLLRVLWPVAKEAFLEIEGATGKETSPAEPSPPSLKRVPAGWAMPEFTQPEIAAAELELTRVEFDWAGETARRVGSLVHAELQQLDFQALDSTALRGREAYHRRWLAAAGLPPSRLTEAVARVAAALQGVLSDERGQWILKTHPKDDLREHALSGLFQGEVTHAVFDRSFIDEAGMRWVIDYKTSQHLGSGLAQFLDREVERYRGQLERYAALAQRLGPEPVRLGLYFPLMRAWRELGFKGIDESPILDI